MSARKGGPGEDTALWEHVARDVKPLRRRARAPEKPPGKPKKEPSRKTKAPVPRPPASAAPAPAPVLASGAAPGLDRRMAARLKRGRLPIEGRLDLHGMTREAARAALAGFLSAAQGRGARCVLVITGKGSRGEGGGVIRAGLARWLNEPELRPLVVAFAEARPADGGAGAFYVYLRRKRAP